MKRTMLIAVAALGLGLVAAESASAQGFGIYIGRGGVSAGYHSGYNNYHSYRGYGYQSRYRNSYSPYYGAPSRYRAHYSTRSYWAPNRGYYNASPRYYGNSRYYHR